MQPYSKKWLRHFFDSLSRGGRTSLPAVLIPRLLLRRLGRGDGLGIVGVKDRLGRGGQSGQALDLAGDNDLGGFAVGGGLEGLQGLDLDHAIAGGGLVDELDGVGSRCV